MNLTKLFNYKFLKQNLKKSSSILYFCCLIVPLLNLIVLLLFGQNSEYSSTSLAGISIVNAILLFIVPLILSLILFGFLLKKRSSDFVLSMPLSRKEIFISNTIGGISLIFLMMLVNTLMLLIFTFVIPILNISIAMIIDYFILWLIAYIFVFTLYNLAILVSGNVITSLVVSVLLMFLLPIISAYSGAKIISYGNYELMCKDKECVPQEYLCYDDFKCLNEIEKGYYTTYIDNNDEYFNNYITNHFTMPSKLFFYLFDTNHNNLYNNISIIKMLISSIIFGGLGYYALLKRKTEIAETSFNNDKIHLLVKCLTCIPFVIYLFEIVDNYQFDKLMSVFLLILLVIYYYVYDFILRRKVKNKSLSIGSFILTIVLVIIFCTINNNIEIGNHKTYTNKDIEGMYVIPINYRYVYADSPKFETTYRNDKEYINLISKYLYNNQNNNNGNYNIIVNLKVDGKYFRKNISVGKEDYQEIVDMTINDEKFIQEYRDINYDNIYNIKFKNRNIDRNDLSELIDLVKTSINKIDLNTYDEDRGSDEITLYLYENHRINLYHIPISINDDIVSYVIEISNRAFYKHIDKNKFDRIYISSIEDREDFNYVVSAATNELLEFVKKDYKNDFDANKEYLLLYLNNDSYYTNDIDQVYEIINKKREEIKGTFEYRNMFKVMIDD